MCAYKTKASMYYPFNTQRSTRENINWRSTRENINKKKELDNINEFLLNYTHKYNLEHSDIWIIQFTILMLVSDLTEHQIQKIWKEIYSNIKKIHIIILQGYTISTQYINKVLNFIDKSHWSNNDSSQFFDPNPLSNTNVSYDNSEFIANKAVKSSLVLKPIEDILLI